MMANLSASLVIPPVVYTAGLYSHLYFMYQEEHLLPDELPCHVIFQGKRHPEAIQ